MSEQTVLDLDAARARKRTRRKPRQRQEESAEPFPDPFPEAAALEVLRLARLDGYSFAQALFATRTVKYWAEGGNKEERIVRKISWPKTIANAMRRGWGIQGFEKWRRLQTLHAWTDQPLRIFLFQDLETCISRRARGIKDFVPRTRTVTIEDSRLT